MTTKAANDFKPEDPANVNLVATKKPDPEIAKHKAEEFVERFVQVGFPGKDPHGKQRLEYTWVLVTRVIDSETVHGLVENDTVLDGVPDYGSDVDVPLAQIIKVLPEFKTEKSSEK